MKALPLGLPVPSTLHMGHEEALCHGRDRSAELQTLANTGEYPCVEYGLEVIASLVAHCDQLEHALRDLIAARTTARLDAERLYQALKREARIGFSAPLALASVLCAEL